MVCHVSVPGDQSSAAFTDLVTSYPSSAVPPPVTRAVPSGSNVVLWNARGYAIDWIGCQAGDGSVMSSTNAVAAAFPGVPLSAAVPDFRIFPGRYMAELWPSLTTASTVVQVRAAGLNFEV